MSILQKGCLSVVLGAQWGDEGKGQLSDILCAEAEICARCAGGNNAGNTIVVGDIKYDFHMLPSGKNVSKYFSEVPNFLKTSQIQPKILSFLTAASFISTPASSVECNSE